MNKEIYYLYGDSILSEGIMHIIYAEKRKSGEVEEPFITWLSKHQQLS